MRDNLIPYVLNLLDAEERALLEAQLQLDAAIQSDLQLVRQALALFEHDCDELPAPDRLAERTRQRLQEILGNLPGKPPRNEP